MHNSLQFSEPGIREQIGWRFRALFGDPIPKQALGFCFEQMAVLLAAGISIPDAFRRAARGTDPELRHIAEAVYEPLSRGMPLSHALAPWRNRLPEIVLPVLEVGEVAGTMEGSARRLADAFNLAASIDRKYRYAVFDPWLAILLLTLYNAAMHLVPNLAVMLQGALTTFMTLSCCYLGGRLLLRLLFRWQALRLAVDQVKLALPHAGTVARNLAAARWARSFVTLWNSGVPVSTALEVSSRSALNAYYERALRRAALQTRQGHTLYDSLARTELLPGYLLGIIATGEESGKLGDALEQFVTLLEAEAFTKASQEFMMFVAGFEFFTLILFAAATMR